MVERYRRGKGKRKLLGSHQKCWIWGRHVVGETLRAGRWLPIEVRLSNRLDAAESAALRDRAAELGVPVLVEPPEALRKRCRSSEHQGCVAKMPEFPYAEADDVLAAAPASPLYAILDSIQDPYNLGAIVRSAAGLGVDAVFLRAAGQVGVTSLVARTSAGAVSALPIARTDDLAALVGRLKNAVVQVLAACETAERILSDCDFRPPSAVIIGSEGTGVSAELRELSDGLVQIPQTGRIASLNAAVSASIFFYEAARQRQKRGQAPFRASEAAARV